MQITPIGTIRSPYTEIENVPIQPRGAQKVIGEVELLPEMALGLKDLDGFSHLYLIYHFHKAIRTEYTVTPFMDTTQRGVFSTRSPLRPNHIGISIVKLLQIENCTLKIEGVDVLDGTPLLDIKPYIKNFDEVTNSSSGWMTASSEEVARKRSDNRFR